MVSLRNKEITVISHENSFKYRALSCFYAYHSAESLPVSLLGLYFIQSSKQTVMHKCSLGGDGIWMNLGEKEAVSHNKASEPSAVLWSSDCFSPVCISLQLSGLDVLSHFIT